MIASILELLKIFSEVIVEFKCGPLAGLKNRLTGPTEKFL